MAFDGKAVGEGYPSAGRMPGVAPVAGLQKHRVEHAEFSDFTADAVDFHPVAQTDAVAAHQDQPAEKRDDEVLESHRQARADDADRGRELARHAHDDEQDDDHANDAQADPCDAAQSFDLPAIQFWAVEQMLHPAVEQQQNDRYADDDQDIQQ